MHRHLMSAIGTLAVIGLLAGCGKSSKSLGPAGSGTDGTGVSSAAAAVARAQANDQIAANPQLIDEDAYSNASPMSLDAGTLGSAALIHPLHWFRRIDSVERSITTDVSDPDSLGRPRTAIVTVNKVLKGSLHILASDSVGTDTSRITKPIEDHWTRKLLLKRVWIDSSGTKAKWHIVGTSGVNIATANGTTRILSVRVQSGAKDTTITDPLMLHLRRRMLHVAAEDSVVVTVTTSQGDDDVFLYHGFDRRKLHSNGDGTFSIVFRTGDFEGLHHFAVDALSRGTLHDDTAAYSSNAWVFPFATRDHDSEVENEDHHR